MPGRDDSLNLLYINWLMSNNSYFLVHINSCNCHGGRPALTLHDASECLEVLGTNTCHAFEVNSKLQDVLLEI